tara:strand:- start:1118 stop:1450 length:333 start_codon:yes stop_codon:yes gene_type:complete
MKDQKSLDEKETALEKWDRAKTLMLESLYKPDSTLRSCAYNQGCKDDLMSIRDKVVEMVKSMPNPHKPKLKPGEKNTHVEPTTMTPNGLISNTLLRGALGDYYRKQMKEE